ncbi:DUF2064 domain-containing protein [Arenibacter sp. F26102]|uniref:TIGR04282 family arsenosugar biosynthesis glycosyltransferase n=1 Tax=Arenibacter sp. F26102 TaxID=2926416 RepID=UPI001FF5B814|nr:DUF2064 domain-containing protein [Arenibacter sp. F26102]MCK0144085.1 DUF2064 domain-containing protein [Arenibacter sp. F26102]
MPETLKIFTTAILVFANSSREELKHKAIPKGNVLFKGLTEHAICTVKKTGLPYFLLTEKEQYGNSFGERFVNAINSIFDKGFDNVITIGNDTPQLKVSDILKASGYLSANKFVLGPSRDGGFYLMGLNKSQFDARDFKDLPWKTNSLTKKITEFIEVSNIQIIQLRTLLDLDNNTDLKRILEGFRTYSSKIFHTIKTIIIPMKRYFHHRSIFINFYFVSNYFNKGSPSGSTIFS